MPTNKNKVTKATKPEPITEQKLNEEIIDAVNQICRSCTILKAYDNKYGYDFLFCSMSAADYILFKRNIITSYRQLEETYSQLLKIEKEEEF